MSEAERPQAMGSSPGVVLALFEFEALALSFEAACNVLEQVRQALLRLRQTISGVEIMDVLPEGQRQFPPELVNGVLVYTAIMDFRIDYRES